MGRFSACYGAALGLYWSVCKKFLDRWRERGGVELVLYVVFQRLRQSLRMLECSISLVSSDREASDYELNCCLVLLVSLCRQNGAPRGPPSS